MICENGYKLKLKNGKILEFNSDLELDAYFDDLISKHPDILESSDLLTRAVDFQKQTIDILDEISKKVSSVSQLVTKKTTKEDLEATVSGSVDPEDEIITYYKIPKSIGVNRFLQTIEQSSTGNYFTTAFNEDSWIINRVEFLKEQLKKKDPSKSDLEINNEVLELVKKETAAWKLFSETGEEIHKIYELVLSNKSCEYNSKDWIHLNSDQFSDIKSEAIKFKEELLKRHGNNAKFYTEFGIISDELTGEIKEQLEARKLETINGKIDLLVVDEYGNAHIYDYKVSRHEVGDWKTETNEITRNLKQWHSLKKRNASLQLAFYAKLLQQYGIKVNSTHIVPIQTSYDYEDMENEIGIKSFNGAKRANDINVPDVLSGKYSLMAKEVFVSKFSINGMQLASWAETFNKLFPSQSVKKYQENLGRDVEYYRNNKDYTTELLPSDDMYKKGKRFAFRKKGISYGLVYAETEEKLNDVIAEYIEALASKRSEMCIDYASRISAVMRGEMTIDEFAEIAPIEAQTWITSQFKRYFDENWSFAEDDILNANGVFIFEKGGICEITMISDEPLTNVINLGLGTTILGKNTKDMHADKTKIFESSYGHIRLMELMIYISQNQDKFRGRKIQQVRVVNPNMQYETTALNSQLLYNFDQLWLKNKDVNLWSIDPNIFIDDVTALIEGAKSRMLSLDPDMLNRIDLNKTESIESYIDTCIALLKKRYGIYKWSSENIDMSKPEWQAYALLSKAKNFIHGVESHNEVNKGEYLQKGKGLTGTMISSLQYSPSANLRELGKIIDNFSADVSKACYEDGFKMQKLFQAVYKKHGNGTKAFSHWFRRGKDGKLDDRLLFVDPDSASFNGSKEDKEALHELLEILNTLRFGKLNDADKVKLKESFQWYELPLTEAVGSTQIKNLGFVTAIKNKWQQFTTLTKDVFAEDEEEVLENNWSRTKLYNKFELTSGARYKKIRAHGGVGFFDLNVERVFNQALVAYKKSEISKEYLPLIAGLRLSLMYQSSYENHNVSDIVKTFDKAVKSKIYGESIVSKELRGPYKLLSFVRSMFTKLALSLNFTSFFRETLQGIYNGAARAGVKMIPGVDEKNYLKALSYVIKECPQNVSGVTMLQQLNTVYKMANQSMGSIAQNRRVNWLNIKNWNEDTLFLTATAPDFLHRVSILVAKMMGDGCWEAHSLDENGKLVYDFKKDGRFQHYINNETSHRDYLKEKSLYETMMEQFISDGYTKEDGSPLTLGDALPNAYTDTEAQTIKNFGDLLYGHYDEESKSLFCDTFVGTFIMQYKTFLTSKLEQWTMSAGMHNTELLKQQFDSETGEELYQVIHYDENDTEKGNPHRLIKRKSELTEEEINSNNARLYYDYEGIPMNGLLWESAHFVKSVLTWDQKELDRIWNDPVERGYLLLALHDQFIMMLLTLLVTFITGEFADVEKPLDARQVRNAVKTMGPMEQLAYNVVWGSLKDSQFQNILGNFAQNPPMVTQVQKFVTSNWQVITGKHIVPYAFTHNIGAIRNFEGLVINAEKLTN